MLGLASGGEESLAQKIIEFVENSSEAYPNRDRYSLIGPNSNTYTQGAR